MNLTNRLLPYSIVFLCAILESKLVVDFYLRTNPDTGAQLNNLYSVLIYVIFSAWIIAIWFLLGLIPHLFALVYDAKGSFSKLLPKIGYGFLPMLIGIAFCFNLFDKIILPDKVTLEFIKTNKIINTIGLINRYTMYALIPWTIYCIYKNSSLSILKSSICVILPFTTIYLLSNLLSNLI